MKRCKKCGQVWCANCASQGKWPGPKSSASNVCPYCGAYQQIETLK